MRAVAGWESIARGGVRSWFPAFVAGTGNLVERRTADSVGCFGSTLPGTTPHIDELGEGSLKFAYAHVQVGNCYPARATARRVWKCGGVSSRSTMTVSTWMNPAASIISASSASGKPSQVSA